ncbi:MAG: respiratory nitrate reductase subunit gamma [Deltaproteobacteria bacterium]
MSDTIFYVIMVPMVYFALAWCIAGITVKIVSLVKAPSFPHTLKIFPETKTPGLAAVLDAFTMPTVREHKPLLWVFLIVFHVCILLLLLAHLDLLPQINILSAESANMIGSGAVGLLLTLSVLYFLFRRFRTPVRELSVPADYLLLFLLFCLFISGDIISWGNSWSSDGFVITKQDFGQYLDGLLKFSFADPRDMLTGSHYSIVATHVLLANLFLIVLPFSKIMHTFFAVPLNKLRRG